MVLCEIIAFDHLILLCEKLTAQCLGENVKFNRDSHKKKQIHNKKIIRFSPLFLRYDKCDCVIALMRENAYIKVLP